jgi:hypothetical protein
MPGANAPEMTDTKPFPLNELTSLFAVRFSRTIDCTKEALLDATLRESWLLPMHPFVKTHSTPNLPIVAGSKDSLQYHSGIVINRTYGETETGPGYLTSHVEVSIAGMQEQLAGYVRTTMKASDTGTPNQCLCEVTLERANEWSDGESNLTLQYLDQMLQGFAYYLETGKPVTKNQFGSHPIYSPA